MQVLSVIERLEIEAQNGKYEKEMTLWKRTISSLKKKGLNVQILSSIEPAKFRCLISWENGYDDDTAPTIPHNLWLMAKSSMVNKRTP